MKRSDLATIVKGRRSFKKFCTVQTVLPRGRYEVKDSAGTISTAESAASYQVADQVTVIDGRIVGPARRFARPKIFRV